MATRGYNIQICVDGLDHCDSSLLLGLLLRYLHHFAAGRFSEVRFQLDCIAYGFLYCFRAALLNPERHLQIFKLV